MKIHGCRLVVKLTKVLERSFNAIILDVSEVLAKSPKAMLGTLCLKHARHADMIDVTNLGYHDKLSPMCLSMPLESNLRNYLSVVNPSLDSILFPKCARRRNVIC